MSSQAGKFRAENWALPSVSWHGTLLLAWDTTGKEGFLLSVGERLQCPGPRAAAVILLTAQVRARIPRDGLSLPSGMVPSPGTHITHHSSGLSVRCLLFLRLVSALCCIHLGDSFGRSFDGPICSSQDNLLPYIYLT